MRYILVCLLLSLALTAPNSGVAVFQPGFELSYIGTAVQKLLEEKLSFTVENEINVTGFRVNVLNTPEIKYEPFPKPMKSEMTPLQQILVQGNTSTKFDLLIEILTGGLFKETVEIQVSDGRLIGVFLKPVKDYKGFTKLRVSGHSTTSTVNIKGSKTPFFTKIEAELKDQITNNLSTALKRGLEALFNQDDLRIIPEAPIQLNENTTFKGILAENSIFKEEKGLKVYLEGRTTFKGIESPLKPTSPTEIAEETKNVTFSSFVGESWKSLLTQTGASTAVFESSEEIKFDSSKLSGIFKESAIADLNLDSKFSVETTNKDLEWSFEGENELKLGNWKIDFKILAPSKSDSVVELGGHSLVFEAILGLSIENGKFESYFKSIALSSFESSDQVEDKTKFKVLIEQYLSPVASLAFKKAISAEIPFASLFSLENPKFVLNKEKKSITFIQGDKEQNVAEQLLFLAKN